MADDRRFKGRDEAEQDAFRGQLTAYWNLCAFVRNLIANLPPPGDGHAFALDDEVALCLLRLQQMTKRQFQVLANGLNLIAQLVPKP